MERDTIDHGHAKQCRHICHFFFSTGFFFCLRSSTVHAVRWNESSTKLIKIDTKLFKQNEIKEMENGHDKYNATAIVLDTL